MVATHSVFVSIGQPNFSTTKDAFLDVRNPDCHKYNQVFFFYNLQKQLNSSKKSDKKLKIS